ncbi:unnamed protein product [Gadus morhua 'NCC']
MEDRGTWTLTAVTVACVAALYVPTVQRTVPGGDSGELITAACELGVAHPPGYPTFTLLARLAMGLLPSFSPAHSVSLMCGLLGALASGALCFTVCRLSGPGPGALLAGGAFAVTRLTWQWSTVAEVFSLNNLFVGLLFSLIACFYNPGVRNRSLDASKRRKIAHLGALCCGLGLCNQHTMVLFVVPTALWVLVQLHSDGGLSLRLLVTLGVCFITGLVPYVYLPISSSLNTARWSWGDQTDLSGFLTHLLRREYGTFSLAKTESSVTVATMLKAQVDHWYADYPFLFCLVFYPAFYNGYGKVSGLFTTMLCVYMLFFAWRANLDISKPLLLGVVERFWLQSDAIAVVLAGLVLGGPKGGLMKRLGYRRLWRTSGWVVTVGVLVHMAHSNYWTCDQSRNDVVENFGRQILASMPRKAIVLTRGDLPGNTLRYLHYCRGVRADVTLVDQEMMTYPWYVAKLRSHHPGVHFPGRWWDPVRSEEKGTFSLEHFLSNNTHRPVLACIGLTDGDPSWERSFTRWPLGVCDLLVPAHTHFHPEDWAHRTRNLYQWSQPHNSFHPGSWEHVANEEMWQARMKTAFFLYDLAEGMEGDGKARLYQLSYTLYKEIVEAYPVYPPNWDRNMALACERLLRSGPQGPGVAERLLSCGIKHFSLYLTKERQEPQAPAIRSAIAQLLQERERLRQNLVQGP